MLVPNECTICKDECCVYEYDPSGPGILGGEGYWWCDSCECHLPPDWFDAWDTLD